MTKKEIIVLKTLKKNYKVGMCVNTADIREKTSLEPWVFDAVCEELAEKGYLKDFENDLSHQSYTFYTTYKADSYSEEFRNSRIKYVVCSIIVPIVIGTLSAVISTYIRYGLLNL